MKKPLILLAIVLIYAGAASAQSYKLGLGARVSTNAPAVKHGISLKYFMTESVAVEGIVSLGSPFAIGALLEKHKPLQDQYLQWFYGGGFYVGFGGDRHFGLQGVLGLDYKFPTLPINLSLDWKPEFNLSTEASFEPAALGLSARFTFK